MTQVETILRAALKELVEAEKAYADAGWALHCQERRTKAGKLAYDRLWDERREARTRLSEARDRAEAVLAGEVQ